MNNQWRQLKGSQLKLNFLESIEYKVKKGQAKALEFGKDEAALAAQIKKIKNGLSISIGSGVKN
jgi:hypothetical protein